MRHRTRTTLTVVLAAAVAGCGSSEPNDAAGAGASAADVIEAPPATGGPDNTTDDIEDDPGDTSAADETGTAPAETTGTAPAETTPPGEADPADDADPADETDVVADDEAGAPIDGPSAPGVIDVELTADERAAADDPVALAITSAFPPGFAPPSEEQARCVGGKIVNEVGTDRLAELGITADSIDIFGVTDFTADEVDAMVDILFECVDVEFMVASMFAPAAGPETAECFADFVDEQLIRDLATPFLGGGALDADFFLEQVGAANAACLPADG